MTPQEQQLIAGLTDRVQKTSLPEKDRDAEQMIQSGLGRNPDSLYILAQTVLVQQFALEQAQQQLAEARAQQQQPKQATSFLGSIFGHNEPDERPAPPPPPPPGYQPVPGYTPSSSAGAPQYGQPPYAGGYGQPQFSGASAPQGGGFLRSALQTATGVAAGALAFQGIESLMHGFGSEGGGRGFGDLGNSGRPEEIVNNYYGDSAGNRGDTGLSSDIEDRRGDAGDRFAGSGDGGSLDDQTDSGLNNGDTDGDLSDSSFDNDSNNGSFDSGGDDFGGGDDSSFS